MEKSSFIKKNIALFVIVIILITVISIIIKYYVEGEKNMPFNISKVMVISSASGTQKENSKIKWDVELDQNNDIYINIVRNKNYGTKEIIDKVIIDNIKIEETPKVGEIKNYRPSEEIQNFKNTKEYQIEDKLEYQGGEESDITNLKIANQGGLIVIRYSNPKIGNYKSDQDTQISYDGTLLGKIGLTSEQIKFKVSFDILMELKSGKKYKANLILEMPKGDLEKEGTTNYEINGDKIVFKRY